MKRPPFVAALHEWQRRLEAAQAPTKIRWVLSENLCIHHKTGPGGRHHLLYQLEWPSVSEANVCDVYERVAPVSECVAFQRLFSEADFSLCTLAGDPWESEDEELDEGRNLYFTTGSPYELHSEIKSVWEWRWRRLRGKGILSGVDFVFSQRLAMAIPLAPQGAG